MDNNNIANIQSQDDSSDDNDRNNRNGNRKKSGSGIATFRNGNININ